MPVGSYPCPSCGRPVAPEDRTCPNCGALTEARSAVPVAGPLPFDGEPVPDPGPPDAELVPDPGPTYVADPVGVHHDPPPAPVGTASPGPLGGSYLPPSTVHRPPPSDPMPAQMPLADSPAVGMAPPSAEGASPGGPEANPVDRPVAPVVPGRAPLFADLPFDAPDTLAGWLVSIGGGAAALSFVMPWAPRVVNYADSWGLAAISHLPVLGLLVATVVLGVLPNRVATWVRSGVLGLVGGSLFLGILWPYVAGDFGAEWGSIVGAAASLVLIIGGTLGVAPRRERPSPT